jgi:APA family basic amino acid/polyamine antiporter
MNDETPASAPLVRTIGLGGAVSIVIGSVVGSAIFLTTGLMAEQLPSPGLILLAWATGGALALAGGLTCAELSAMYPHSGGWYVFLNEAYSQLWGFLFGWAGLLVMLTGSLAAVAAGFAEYFAYFVPSAGTSHVLWSAAVPWGTYTLTAAQVVAALSIVAVGVVNYVGIGSGNALQAGLTLLKVAAIAAIALLAFVKHPVTPDFSLSVAGVTHPLRSFGVAMIAVLWAYSGWDYLSLAAGDVKDPARNLPRAMILGIAGLTLLYLLVNVGYMLSVDVRSMSGMLRIAEQSMNALVGSAGAAAVSAIVLLSCFGCNASCVLPIARVCFAMSSDGVFVRAAAAVHPRFGTPHAAITLTCGWAVILTLSGTYEQLYTYVTFTALVFNVAGGYAIFRLRKTKPNHPRPYRVWGYPIVPALFVASTGALLINTLIERPVESVIGLALMLIGIPVYLFRQRATTLSAR